MKELSIEEKARRYDEAIEYAHYLINERCKEGTDDSFHRADLDKMFPELKESEDERIMKGLLYVIEHHPTLPTEEAEEYIAWLEKQVEQKPANLPKGEDYGIDGLWHATRILEQTLGKVEGYQSDDGILEHKCAITAVKKLSKQKPVEWSEEDERKLELLKALVEDAKGDSTSYSTMFREMDELNNWLKSLRPQNAWKPSEEHYELEEFAKIVRGNLTGISKTVQNLFEAKYLQLTGKKMYGGYMD